jgi:hypothetical protein
MARFRPIDLFLSAVFTVTLTSPLSYPVSVAAQGETPSAQVGEIELEDTSTVKRNPYDVGQDAAIAYFNDFSATLETLRTTGSAQLQPLNDAAINHLVGVYLYCTVRSGACPLVLDGILEIDVVNAKNGATELCPTMERFWKTWLKGDMEKRLNFLVRTAHMNTTSEFTRVQRPRYLKCRDTVKQEIAGAKPAKDFFATRYSEANGPDKKVRRLASLLVELKTKVPNTLEAAERER